MPQSTNFIPALLEYYRDHGWTAFAVLVMRSYAEESKIALNELYQIILDHDCPLDLADSVWVSA